MSAKQRKRVNAWCRLRGWGKTVQSYCQYTRTKRYFKDRRLVGNVRQTYSFGSLFDRLFPGF